MRFVLVLHGSRLITANHRLGTLGRHSKTTESQRHHALYIGALWNQKKHEERKAKRGKKKSKSKRKEKK